MLSDHTSSQYQVNHPGIGSGTLLLLCSKLYTLVHSFIYGLHRTVTEASGKYSPLLDCAAFSYVLWMEHAWLMCCLVYFL